MKLKVLRKIALAGTLIFTLSSTGIYAESPTNVSNANYFNVQKYGDNKVKDVNEKSANIKDPEEIKRLTNLGFTEDEIATFSVSDYERYKNKNGKVVSKSTKYYRATKDSMEEITETQVKKEVKEYEAKKAAKKKVSLNLINNQLLAFDGSLGKIMTLLSSTGGSDTEQTESWLSMTTTVSCTGGKTFLFKNSWTWITQPCLTLTDVVGLSHNPCISVDQDSDILVYTYDNYDGMDRYIGYDNIHYFTADKKSSTGYAFKYDIVSSDANCFLAKNQHGYLSYTGVATPSSYVGYSNVYGHYSHQQITCSIGLDITTGSMSVTPSFCFDDATDTDAQYYIN